MFKRILILAGTPEARELADALQSCPEIETIISLAGLVPPKSAYPGKLRTGGFGSSNGLINYLQSQKIHALVDAVHPFASRMSQNAQFACKAAQIPLFRLKRPAWTVEDGDLWEIYPSIDAAIRDLPDKARTLVTIGRDWQACLARTNVHFLVRLMAPAAHPPPHHIQCHVQDTEFHEQAEADFMRRASITHLVTKNAGGSSGMGKIKAARALGLRVHMIDRPILPKVAGWHASSAAQAEQQIRSWLASSLPIK